MHPRALECASFSNAWFVLRSHFKAGGSLWRQELWLRRMLSLLESWLMRYEVKWCSPFCSWEWTLSHGSASWWACAGLSCSGKPTSWWEHTSLLCVETRSTVFSICSLTEHLLGELSDRLGNGSVGILSVENKNPDCFSWWPFYNECLYILVNEYHSDSMTTFWVTLESVLLGSPTKAALLIIEKFSLLAIILYY